MNFTKSILLTVIYSAGLLIPAMTVAAAEQDTFQADKDREIAKVLEKVQVAQKHLSCVQAAQNHEELNACEEAFKPKQDVPETKAKEPEADKKEQKIEKSKKK